MGSERNDYELTLEDETANEVPIVGGLGAARRGRDNPAAVIIS
jgi:hypothetical protein